MHRVCLERLHGVLDLLPGKGPFFPHRINPASSAHPSLQLELDIYMYSEATAVMSLLINS